MRLFGIFCAVFLGFALLTGSAHAGDAYIKGGFILHPTENLDLSERYLIDFGSDYFVSDFVGLGWEVATAYYSEDFGGETFHVVPLNVWGNVKIAPPTEGIRPFGKAGLGLLTTFVSFGGENDNQSNLGFHFTGGLELGAPGRVAFVLELQGQKEFADNRDFTWIFLAGVQF